MQFAGRINIVGGVLPRGKYDEVAARFQIHARKRPFVQLLRVIGQTVSRQINRLVSGVVDFDPIGRVSVAVIQGALIAGHELGDHEVGRKQLSSFQRFQRESSGYGGPSPTCGSLARPPDRVGPPVGTKESAGRKFIRPGAEPSCGGHGFSLMMRMGLRPTS